MASILPNEGVVELLALGGSVGSPVAFTVIATGTGNTAFSASSSALNTELEASGLSRATATVTQVTTTFTSDTLQFVKAFSVTGTQTVKEIGVTNKTVKDAAGEKWLYLEVIDTERSLVSGNTYTVTIKIIGARA